MDGLEIMERSREMKNTLGRFAPLAAFAGLVLTAGAASSAESSTAPHGGASAWVKTEQTEVRLVAASSALGGAKTVRLGLQFKMKPGWKIYWRAPGDAGFPPRLDWRKSQNLAGARLDWPAPTRFSVLGFETQGYKKEVIFPITAKVDDPARPLSLRAELNYLTCDDVCIPYQTELSLDLATGAAQTTPSFQDINRFAARVPGNGQAHGLKITKAELAGALGPEIKGARNGTLRVLASAATPFGAPDIFVEGPEEMVFSRPKARLSDDRRAVSLLIPVSVDGQRALAGGELTFTLTDGPRSAERKLSIAQGPPVSAQPGGLFSAYSLPIILGLALLGGLILNLMPCVLPVLSLKLVGLVSHGGAKAGTVRISFLATSAGIIFSFLVLAGGLVGLKLAGQAVGWGIQFQHPWFLIALTLIVALFAYNLWGLFEINLPYWLSGIGGGQGGTQSIGGNFATGAFATLLATPCSAPFLGTAVGFALAGGNAETFAVFTALGMGMAAPYLLVAAFPGLASRLPRPGAWMVRVKQIMGVALAATAVWLLSVIAVQVSLGAALVLGAMMAALGAVFQLRRSLSEARRWVSGALIAGLVAGAFFVPGQFEPGPAASAEAKAHWQPFDAAAIPRLVADGKTVFVDVTAEWCITCQVNKAAVLNRGEVFDLLAGESVIAMRADWTRPSDAIAQYLASFGRFGIPFNAVYGPKAPMGVVLPELLTSGLVLSGLEKASGTPNIAAR